MKINNWQGKSQIHLEWNDLTLLDNMFLLTLMVNLQVERGKFTPVVKCNGTKEETSPASRDFMETK